MTREKTITAYKAFNKDWTCRGFQYEVGKTYEHEGPVDACYRGFHACLNPLDCWSYYDITDCNFAAVELSGDTDDHGEDSKIAAARITIETELTLPDFIDAGVDWLISHAKSETSSGNSAQLASSGNFAQLASSGNSAQLASSGYSAKLASSGHFAKLASSGDFAKLASSGDSAQLASSGDFAKLASSGDFAKLASSGYSAKLASSGNSAKLASSGDFAKLASSGYSAKLASSGKGGVIASSGMDARAKGAKGTWISLAEFKNGKCVGFATGCIGEDGLKPDTFYRAQGGKLVEADQ